MSTESIFKVIFYNEGEVYEIYARNIYHSETMYGFIELEEFLFGERAQVIVDPGEEKLKTEFEGVKRSYIPLTSIIRIDEVEKEGQVKVSEVKGSSNITHFPAKSRTIPKPTNHDS